MTNTERIQAHNAELREAIELAENLPDAGTAVEVVLQDKTITPTKSEQKIKADADYTGLNEVTVEAIPSEYIVPSGGKHIYENGLHDVTAYASVEVDVPSKEPVIQPLEVIENGTYAASEGVDGYSPVTVNIPIPDGYIQPSGTLEVTENGAYDVTEKAEVVVNVESGSDSNEEADALIDVIQNDAVDFENDRITKVGQYALAYKTNLKSISLPNLKTSNTRVFANCDSLISLSIPNMTGYTYQYMAAYCGALKTVDVKQTSYVSSYSFYGCSALTKLEFNRVSTIATNAFYNCNKLETLILRSESVVTLGGTNALTNTKIAGTGGYIYVPSALINDYKTATNWSTYESKFRAIEDYPDICG